MLYHFKQSNLLIFFLLLFQIDRSESSILKSPDRKIQVTFSRDFDSDSLLHLYYMAEMQESGRDQGHCTLSLALLTTICQLDENQGDDIWGFNDNLILKASEYVAKYNVANLAVHYMVYSWHEGDPWSGCGVKTTELPSIGSGGRGSKRPQWELISNHYVVREGLSAPYVEMAARVHRPEGGGGDYGPNSGGFDQLGFGTLLYTLE